MPIFDETEEERKKEKIGPLVATMKCLSMAVLSGEIFLFYIYHLSCCYLVTSTPHSPNQNLIIKLAEEPNKNQQCIK